MPGHKTYPAADDIPADIANGRVLMQSAENKTQVSTLALDLGSDKKQQNGHGPNLGQHGWLVNQRCGHMDGQQAVQKQRSESQDVGYHQDRQEVGVAEEVRDVRSNAYVGSKNERPPEWRRRWRCNQHIWL